MNSLPQSQPSDDIDDNDLFGHLLDYQATDEFTQDVMRQQAIEYRPTPKQQVAANKRYRIKYPHATKLRQQAIKHKTTLYDNQHGICYWCNLPMTDSYEVDHINPISKGGDNELSNLCVCHPRCNKKKMTKTLKR